MMQEMITKVCDEVKEMLLEKNRAYGDSASDPLRVFSSVDTIEQINVRIDDKLSRIKRGHEFGTDDTELDLIGYLILKRAVKALYPKEIRYTITEVNNVKQKETYTPSQLKRMIQFLDELRRL